MVLTSLPTRMALPTISWPTQRGPSNSPHPPVMVWTSDPQTPQHSISTSMSVSAKGLGLSSVRLNLFHVLGESTVKPSKVSGYPILDVM